MHTQAVSRAHRALLTPCTSARQLHAWVRLYMQLDVPTEPVCPHHNAPFDYIQKAYFEPSRDLIVWAPRGGGKTRLAAVATLLDLLHKPGVSVRILGGSLEQSLRMWEHLFPDLMRIARPLLAGKPRASRHVHLNNGSNVSVLTQSQRTVRGLRVQKLRCDEVDMFKPEIWEAAQLVTKSKLRSPTRWTAFDGDTIAGAIDALSTFHQPWGLMSRIIEAAPARNTPILHWCILEVLERCPPERDCATCPLWDDCKGVAKTKCSGFVTIDDAIALKSRVSRETWECEMLCKRPSVSGSVFPAFDRDVHLKSEMTNLKSEISDLPSDLSLAVDFGFAAPFVCLWIRTFEDNTAYVIDEYVQPGVQLETHIEQIRTRNFGEVVRLACDPAGAGRSDQTAASNVAVLRHHGFVVRYRKSQIVEGLGLIRTALNPAIGDPKLFIHPRCTRLIKAMQAYHYPPSGGELPVKDGVHDHLIDALRYYYVNRPVTEKGPPRRY